jgi:hypothetical protein
VNSSSQRKGNFDRILTTLIHDSSSLLDKKLNLIMDVASRWDSTCLMLIRAMRLRQAIDILCNEYRPAYPFKIRTIEWKQIGYLIDLLRPFCFFTQTIGKTRSVTIPYVLSIYDELYERLFESRRKLVAKQEKYIWVKVLIAGIEAAQLKLDIYYNKTYGNLGSIYGIGAILNPALKLQSFHPDFCWLDPAKKDWAMEFEDHLRTLYKQSYERNNPSSQRLRHLREENMDPLAVMLTQNRTIRADRLSSSQVEEEHTSDEIDEWLAMSK